MKAFSVGFERKGRRARRTPPCAPFSFGFWRWAAAFLYGGGLLSRRSPEKFFYVDAGFDDWNTFGFEELFLERGVRFADQDFAAGAEDAVPGDGLSSRSGAHGAAGGARAAAEAQGSSEGSIS
jgi:hypothetical protein